MNIKNKHAQSDIKNKCGTTHNLKSQMDIKSTAAKTDIKTNMTQHTTPTSNGH